MTLLKQAASVSFAVALTAACSTVPAPRVPDERLAWFPIGQRGSHTFEVPAGFEVNRVEFQTQRTSTPARGNPTFETCVFRLSLVDAAGGQVANGILRPMGWRFDREGEYTYVVPTSNPVRRLADRPLRLQVDVSEPSVRQWDEARVVLRHGG